MDIHAKFNRNKSSRFKYNVFHQLTIKFFHFAACKWLFHYSVLVLCTSSGLHARCEFMLHMKTIYIYIYVIICAEFYQNSQLDLISEGHWKIKNVIKTPTWTCDQPFFILFRVGLSVFNKHIEFELVDDNIFIKNNDKIINVILEEAKKHLSK